MLSFMIFMGAVLLSNHSTWLDKIIYSLYGQRLKEKQKDDSSGLVVTVNSALVINYQI